MRINSVILCIIYLLISDLCTAQPGSNIININSSDDLSSNSVTSIVQDSLGFIWIGTKRGLNRYDGQRFVTFETGLASNDVSKLLLDSNGDLWVGTVGGGLAIYKMESNTFQTFTNHPNQSQSISSNDITALFEDSEAHLWIGTENGLNLYLNDSTFKKVASPSNDAASPQFPVRCIAEDSRGKLWIGTFGHGLFTLDQQSLTEINQNSKDQISTDFVLTISRHSDKALIIGTRDNGLLKFNLNSGKFSKFLSNWTGQFSRVPIIRTIRKDKNQGLWIGTDGDGLIYVKKEAELEQITHLLKTDMNAPEIVGNAINTTFEDQQGNIWIGTAWNGISVIKNNVTGITRYRSNPSTRYGSPILSIYKNKNSLFLGTDGEGISQIDLASGRVSIIPQFYNKYIQNINQRADGTYWIGTYASGLYNYDPASGRTVQLKHKIGMPNTIIFNDVRGVVDWNLSDSVWIATWGGGLDLFNKKKKAFIHFQAKEDQPHSISSNNITSLLTGADGKIWMTTFGGGLNVFSTHTGQFQSFRFESANQHTLSSDNTLTLCEDSKGLIWIGTWDKGINRVNPNTGEVERFERAKFLKKRTVTAILEDNEGDIWFSTKKGIIFFDQDEQQFRSFPQLYGEYHINSCFKDDDGFLYFGGIEGATRFDPKNIKSSSFNSDLKVILTDFKLFNQSVPVQANGILKKHISLAKSITLEHDQNIITFEFTTMNYPSSAAYEFAIKLEGFDDEWREIGKQRATTFTNLLSGEYRFKVKNKSPGGQWSKAYTSVHLHVLKPFWRTWWAFTLYILVFILFLLLFRKSTVAWEKMRSQLRLKEAIHQKDLELHQVKQRFFNNISHEIRTPVTLMLASINRIMEEIIVNNQLSVHFNSLKRNGDYLLQLVNELLEFRKLEANQVKLKVSKTNITEFINEISLSFKGLATKRKIQFDFKTTDKDSEVWIDTMQMEKVIYNILNNSFKHVEDQGRISVEIITDDQHNYISISDNGKGIAPDHLKNIFKRFYQIDNEKGNSPNGFGIGLSIVKDIVSMHQGDVSVESIINEGSQFVIKLLLGNYHFDENQILNDQPLSDQILSEQTSVEKKDDLEEQNKEIVILVVEDNEELRNYLKSILELRYTILEAANGLEGLTIAIREVPNLIISDVIMPIKDGVELTRNIKEDKNTSHIPVILLTARSGVIYKKEGFDIGADDYITKPFNEGLLKARIKNLIASRRLVWERLNVRSLTEPRDLGISSIDEEFLQNITHLIEDNITKDTLSPDFLAEELAMSHSVIYKKLKHLTGQSIVEFIRDFKLKRGAELILKYKYPIEEACYKAGFSDRRYFSRVFKKKFGETPTDYAKKR